MRISAAFYRRLSTAALLALILIALVAPRDASAWNKPGHMVTGAIAFDALRGRDDGAITRTVELLEHHPYFDASWKGQIPSLPREQQGLVLFMLAARWPDDARMDARFHRGAWHYINYPYVPEGQPSHIHGRDPAPENIVTSFTQNMEIVKNDRSADSDRAIALAWIFHLVGDIHQPLHTVSLFSTQWPDGDHGGNDFIIRAKEENQPIKLHAFWDDLIIGSERFQSLRNASTRIAQTYPRARLPEIEHRKFDQWADESFHLAQSHVYLYGKLPGSVDTVDVPVLTQEYRTAAKTLAERRAALAGYRLAEILKALFN